MTIRKVRVTAYRCRCERCGRIETFIEVPDRCPGCTSRNWLEPAKWKRPDIKDRPPAKKRRSK